MSERIIDMAIECVLAMFGLISLYIISLILHL